MKKKNQISIAAMVRGKAVEEGIKFFLENLDKKSNISDAQHYANDLYYLNTSNLNRDIIKKYALPINALVRTGVIVFCNVLRIIKLSKNNITFKKNNDLFVYPDFVADKIFINGVFENNVCVELKVLQNDSKLPKFDHLKQCYNYSINTGKVTLLVYLIPKKVNKNGVFYINLKIFKIFSKNIVLFEEKFTLQVDG